jgi:uncharacterized protein (TIGR03790 family)
MLAAAFQTAAVAAAPHTEVLVVYNSASADSFAVANHYLGQRNIPASNLCAIAPPANDFLNGLSDYTTYVKTPIQNCLNTVGSKSILYIVMSYLTPFAIYGASPRGTGAVDSYLADIWDKYSTQPVPIVPSLPHPYYADSQSQGNAYLPFQSFAAYRANARNALIYSVWRLDGPSAAIASALVDQAIYAETHGGPSGQACFDEIYDATGYPDSSYPSGNWDLYKAAQFMSAAGIPVLLDSLGTEFGTSPSPTCPNTAFYSGWYSYNNYNNAFSWQPGSIGWHLDSASALNPRSGQSWVANALGLGVTVTSGAVSEPYLTGLTRPGGVFRNLLEGASVGDAFLRNTRWLKWEIFFIGDPLYKPFGVGLPPFSPLQPVNSFLISPQEFVGGGKTTGTLTLSAPAPANTTFNLSAPAGITVPPTVTVAAGATKASFPVTTAAVTSSQANIITASTVSLTLQNTVVTDPLLGGFVPSPGATMAGFPVSVTLLLNGPAPVGGAAIALSSDNSVITVPATVTVPAGATVTTFTATSTPVISTVSANITGTYAGASAGFSIAVVPAISSVLASATTLNPGDSTDIQFFLGTPVPSGNSAVVQLSSSDPASLPVPANVIVPAGGIYQQVLATAAAGSSGKSVTITVTYAGSSGTVTININ